MRNVWSGIRVGYMLVRVCLGHSAIESELEYLQMVFVTCIQPLLYSIMMNSLTHTTDSLLEDTKIWWENSTIPMLELKKQLHINKGNVNLYLNVIFSCSRWNGFLCKLPNSILTFTSSVLIVSTGLWCLRGVRLSCCTSSIWSSANTLKCFNCYSHYYYWHKYIFATVSLIKASISTLRTNSSPRKNHTVPLMKFINI